MFNNNMELLALTTLPEECVSILDWRPFQSGKKLDEIISNYNKSCFENYKTLKVYNDIIKSLGEGIKVVIHSLSTVNDMQKKDFANIRIIIIDLDATGWDRDAINKIRYCIGAHEQKYFLAQISRRKGLSSRRPDFEGLMVIPSEPEIIEDEESFERWLSHFCSSYLKIINVLPHPPSRELCSEVDKRANKIYISNLPRIINQIRDMAITKKLSEKEIGILTRNTAMNELALAQIHSKAYTPKKYNVVVDALREGIRKERILSNIKILDKTHQSNFLALSLIDGTGKVELDKKKVLLELGIRGNSFTSVHFDNQNIRNKVRKLEGVINTTEFKGELPSF